MKKLYKKTKYILSGIGLIIAYQMILPILYFSIFKKFATSENFWISNITYILYYVLVAIGLIVLYRKSLKKEWNIFLENKKEYSKKSLCYWAKGLGLMIVSNIIALSIAGTMVANEAQNREVLSSMPLYAGFIMCLIGPFIEEMIFRKSFKKTFQNKYVFATVTSLIFASLHVINSFDPLTLSNFIENWKQIFFLLPYSSLAFFFALSYYETDSIFTSTLSHCLHNTLTVLLILLTGGLL